MSIVNRRRMMGDKSLPYDFELEYLKRSGLLYINTDVIPTNTMCIEIHIYNLQLGSEAFIGSRRGSVNKDFSIVSQDDGYISFRGGITSANGNIKLTLSSNTDYILKLDLKNKKIFVNGVESATLNFTPQVSTFPLYLFAMNTNGNASNYNNIEESIGETNIYDNDVLVRKYKPVVKNGIGYMYDEVSGLLFGNSGTGNFVLGPYKYYDAEIEYLESNGTLWIDTNVACSTSNIIRATMLANGPQKNNNAYVFFGLGISYIDSNIELFSSMLLNKISGCIKGNSDVELDYTNLFNVELKDKIFTFTDSTGTILATANRSVAPNYTAANTMAIFALNRPSLYIRPNKVRCYKFSILNNSVYILDLIPVRVGQVGYMYDKVSGTLFGNAGTGDFILGPDKN